MDQLLALLEIQARAITVLRDAAENRLQDVVRMHRFHQEEVDMHQADLVRLTALEEGTVALYEQQLAEMEALRIDHADRLATLEKADTLLRQQQTELDLLRTACAERHAISKKSDALLHQQQAELQQLRAMPSPLHQEPPPPADEPNSNQRQRGQSA
jgi:hypothetical protein